VIVAIILDALAYKKRERDTGQCSWRALEHRQRILMGCSTPSSRSLPSRMPGPYRRLLFALGLLLCTALNACMRHRSMAPRPSRCPVIAPSRQPGIGGVFSAEWSGAPSVTNFAASHAHIVGPAISYAIGKEPR